MSLSGGHQNTPLTPEIYEDWWNMITSQHVHLLPFSRRQEEIMTSLSTLQRGLPPDVIVFFWSQCCNFVGVCDSNEAEVSAILEFLRFFSRNFNGGLILKSDSSNVIAWVSNWKANPWKFQFHFNEIRTLSSIINVFFITCLDRPTPWRML